MKTTSVIMGTVMAVMMLTSVVSADMPTVLVGALKEQAQKSNTDDVQVAVTAYAMTVTIKLPIAKTEVVPVDHDILVYNIYNVTANAADQIGMTAAKLGVDNGNPTIGVHVVDKNNAMVMYYTAQDPLSMTAATLSEDVAANLVLT